MTLPLRERERIRREALWTLSLFAPGDPRATGLLNVLYQVERDEKLDDSLPADPVTLENLLTHVQVEPRAKGYSIVPDANIPQPWRERCLQASRGATRSPEGAYEHDWRKFVAMWHDEMMHLAAHRASNDSDGSNQAIR